MHCRRAMSPSASRRRLRLPSSRRDHYRFGGALRRGLLPALTCLSLLTVLAGTAAAQDVTFSSSSYTVNEGAAVTPELVLSHARSVDVTVHVEVLAYGRAKSGEDFAAGPWNVTVPAGRTRQSFSVATFDDDKAEGNEDFLLHIPHDGHSDGVRRSADGTPDAVVTIRPKARVSVSNARVRLQEGGTAKIGVSISPPRPAAFTLDYTLSGTSGTPATSADVTGGFGTRSITVPANAGHVDIPIATLRDTVNNEGVEWLRVRLSTSASGVAFDTTDIDVGIDDADPEVSFVYQLAGANEGWFTHEAFVQLSSAPASDLTVSYTVGGTATAGSDYTALSGTVTVPAGATRATIPVAVRDDSTPEPQETVVLTLTGGSGYQVGTPDTHTLDIKISDARSVPTVGFTQDFGNDVNEDAGTYNVQLRLSSSLSVDLIVHYSMTDRHTTSGSDYKPPSGKVTVPAGATTATVPVTIIDDDDHEQAEVFCLNLGGGVGYRIGAYAGHCVRIRDNDPLPVVTFSSSWSRLGEGAGTHNVALNLDPAQNKNITVRYRVGGRSFGPWRASATSGSDFEAPSGSVTVLAGETTATIPVTIIDDGAHERSESLFLVLQGGAGYWTERVPGVHEILISDNDPRIDVSFASAAQSVVEGAGTRDVTVNLTPAPTANITLDYSVGGTATADTDYTALSGSVTVSAGATTATIPVTITDDSDVEGEETVVLTLTGAEGHRLAAPSTHTLTIATNDGLTSASFASPWQRVVEGGVKRDVTVNLDPPPASDITLNYTVGGSATSGSDYQPLSGTLAVSADSAMATIPVMLLADDVREHHETVVLTLAPGTDYWPASPVSHTLTIVESFAQRFPTASFAAASQRVVERAVTRDVTVNLDPPSASDFTLHYSVGGTATADSDYTALSGSLAVSAGARTATIPVTVLDDSTAEGEETVVLTLSVGTAVLVPGSTISHTLTIAANDDVPSASFASASQSTGEESGAHNVIVNLDPAPASNLTLNYTAGGTATSGSDYQPLSGTLSVPAGSLMATIPVTLLADNVQEDRETVVLTLAPGTGYELASPGRHTLTFGTVPTVTFPSLAAAATESAGTYRVAVHFSPAPTSAITVTYTVGGSATPGDDYQPLSGELTVPAGAAVVYIPVTILDDSVEDSGETVTLRLVGETGRVLRGEDGKTVREKMPGYRVGTRYDDYFLVITNHEAGDLEGRVQARLDAAVAGGGASANLWRRALAAVRDEAPPSGLARLTKADAQALAADHVGSDIELAALWAEIADTIESGVTDPPPTPDPEVTIAAGAGVTEGTAATFTLTATPAPAAALEVTATVAVTGDYGITAGERTVTIPTTGSYELTLATTGDEADEPDGSVSVTVDAGDGYTVGDASSGSVAITDDDPAVPEVTIAAGAGVTEGTAASFTLAATPAPAAALEVTVTVAVTGGYGITGGERTVTIPTTGSYELTLATTGDEADEADGSVSVTVDAGDGYTVGAAPSGTVAIADDDPPGSVLPAGHPLVTYASLVSNIRDVYILDHTDDSKHPKWKRVLKALGDPAYAAYSQAAMTSTEATALYDTHGWARWAPVGAAIAYAERYFAGLVTTPDPASDPEITIAAGAGVTEGGSASFTLTATPAPSAPLDVTVTVAATGDYGITAGTQTVTIPATGSYELTLATTGDEADEADGSVSATVDAGTGYTVGSLSSGSVAIADDDDPPAPAAGAALPGTVAGPLSNGAVTLARPSGWTGSGRIQFGGGSKARDRSKFTTLRIGNVDSDSFEVTWASREPGTLRLTLEWQPVAGSSWHPSDGDARDPRVLTIEDPAQPAPQPQAAGPAVSIAAGSGITEGGSATFTLTAAPAPAAALEVTVTVAATGDYGIAAGERTVTIPTTGAYTLTLATTGDGTDEPDGSVSATVKAGTGYTVGTASSGTVAIADDDAPAPAVSIAAGADVTEGTAATFTLSATPAPAAPLEVTVTVAATGDYGITVGERTVTIPTTGSATLTLATTGDEADEPDGSVTVTVDAGTGYTVGAASSGTVAIADDDLPPPQISVAAGTGVTEGENAVFTVTADRAVDGKRCGSPTYTSI